MKTQNQPENAPVTMASFLLGVDSRINSEFALTKKLLDDLAAEIDRSAKLVQQIFPGER